MSKSRLRTKLPRSAAIPPTEAFSKLRKEMVEKAIVARGVRDELVLGAMRGVPREAFLPHQLCEFAYTDCPLPIEEGQTISQPYIVAFVTEAVALQGGERVLWLRGGCPRRDCRRRVHGRTHRPVGGKGRVDARRPGLRQCARAAQRRHERLAGTCTL